MKKTNKELKALESMIKNTPLSQEKIGELTYQASRVERAFYWESGKLDLVELQVCEEYQEKKKDDTLWGLGESPIYEPYTYDITELYHEFAHVYGLCQGKVYIDLENGGTAPIGYIYEKKQKYTDSNESYTQVTWISFMKIYNEHRYYINIETNEPILF